MKKMLSKSAIVIAFAGSISFGPLSLKASFIWDWMQDHPTEVLELQEIAAAGFEQVLTSLSTMYSQNPEAFVRFFTLCIQETNSPVPTEILDVLKTFNLVDDNAQISDLVRLVILWAVEKEDNGTIKIWSLDDLIKDGWIKLLFGSKTA